MKTIIKLEKDNMNGRQIYAMRQAANVIKQLDMALSRLGKGHDLSSVPGFEGQDFTSALLAEATIAEKLNAPEPEDTQSESQYDDDVQRRNRAFEFPS